MYLAAVRCTWLLSGVPGCCQVYLASVRCTWLLSQCTWLLSQTSRRLLSLSCGNVARTHSMQPVTSQMNSNMNNNIYSDTCRPFTVWEYCTIQEVPDLITVGRHTYFIALQHPISYIVNYCCQSKPVSRHFKAVRVHSGSTANVGKYCHTREFHTPIC